MTRSVDQPPRASAGSQTLPHSRRPQEGTDSSIWSSGQFRVSQDRPDRRDEAHGTPRVGSPVHKWRWRLRRTRRHRTGAPRHSLNQFHGAPSNSIGEPSGLVPGASAGRHRYRRPSACRASATRAMSPQPMSNGVDLVTQVETFRRPSCRCPRLDDRHEPGRHLPKGPLHRYPAARPARTTERCHHLTCPHWELEVFAHDATGEPA